MTKMAEPRHRRILGREIDGVLVRPPNDCEEYVVVLCGLPVSCSANPEYVWRIVQLMRNAYRFGQINARLEPANV